MMDLTRFIEALEAYVDARIKLAHTDAEPTSARLRSEREEAENEADYTRSDLLGAVSEIVNG